MFLNSHFRSQQQLIVMTPMAPVIELQLKSG